MNASTILYPNGSPQSPKSRDHRLVGFRVLGEWGRDGWGVWRPLRGGQGQGFCVIMGHLSVGCVSVGFLWLAWGWPHSVGTCLGCGGGFSQCIWNFLARSLILTCDDIASLTWSHVRNKMVRPHWLWIYCNFYPELLLSWKLLIIPPLTEHHIGAEAIWPICWC